MMDPERFNHDSSAYERPNYKFRCGRAAAWGKPCPNGPGADGSCGGIAACAPFRNDNGRWECRRPASAGGPCESGPMPDGSCALQQPPCTPKRTLRGYRGRVGLFAFALVVAVLAVSFHPFAGSGSFWNAQSPGQLSGAHERFTAESGCTSCHSAHEGGAVTWLRAAFSADNTDQQCLSCHSFGGPANVAHNFNETAGMTPAMLIKGGGPAETECTMCHTEHKGLEANISAFSDQQCQACHEAKFTAFGRDHPAFGERFPYETRTTINFNHVTHFSKHFETKKALAPKESCIACHDVARAGVNVPVGSFEENCAACHQQQIADRPLTVLAMPGMSAAQFASLDHEAIETACGPKSDELRELYQESRETAQAAVDAGDEGDFEPASDSEMTVFQLWLANTDETEILELEADDEAAVGVLSLAQAMSENGAGGIADAVAERNGDVAAKPLLAGLSSELVKRAACAWAANAEYEGAATDNGGWFIDAFTLGYKPTRHADPVVQGWIDFAITAARETEDDDERAQFTALRDELLSLKRGPGSCTKCHAVTDLDAKGSDVDGDDRSLRVEWRHPPADVRPFVKYTHVPHLDLLGLGKACEQCHRIDEKADYASAYGQRNPHKFQSNFLAIKPEQCAQCHKPAEVRNDCLLCHEYHYDPSFKRRMTTNLAAARNKDGTQ